MTGGGIAAMRATSIGDDEMLGGADSIAPWDALAGGCEASFADILRELRPLFPASRLGGEGWARLLERAAEFDRVRAGGRVGRRAEGAVEDSLCLGGFVARSRR